VGPPGSPLRVRRGRLFKLPSALPPGREPGPGGGVARRQGGGGGGGGFLLVPFGWGGCPVLLLVRDVIWRVGAGRAPSPPAGIGPARPAGPCRGSNRAPARRAAPAGRPHARGPRDVTGGRVGAAGCPGPARPGPSRFLPRSPGRAGGNQNSRGASVGVYLLECSPFPAVPFYTCALSCADARRGIRSNPVSEVSVARVARPAWAGPPFRFADSPVWSFLSGPPGPPPAASRGSAGPAFDLIARGPHAHRDPARSPTAVSHVPLFSSDGTPLAGFGRGPDYLAATWPRALHGLT